MQPVRKTFPCIFGLGLGVTRDYTHEGCNSVRSTRRIPSRVVFSLRNLPNERIRVLCILLLCIVPYDSNSHTLVFLIILDREARRSIKRRKLFHPRPGALHEAGTLSIGSKLRVASQHVDNAERHQFVEGLPSRRNQNCDDKPHKTKITTTTSGEVGRSRGSARRSRLIPMVGVAGSEVNPSEVCLELSAPFLSWAENKLGSGVICTRWWNPGLWGIPGRYPHPHRCSWPT